jgi:hypothetical protein
MGGILVLFIYTYIHTYIYIYITRLASNEIFSPSKKYIGTSVGLRTYQYPGTKEYKFKSIMKPFL